MISWLIDEVDIDDVVVIEIVSNLGAAAARLSSYIRSLSRVATWKSFESTLSCAEKFSILGAAPIAD